MRDLLQSERNEIEYLQDQVLAISAHLNYWEGRLDQSKPGSHQQLYAKGQLRIGRERRSELACEISEICSRQILEEA